MRGLKVAASTRCIKKPANLPIKLSVRVVTPRAVARVAPTHPAAYRHRYADSIRIRIEATEATR